MFIWFQKQAIFVVLLQLVKWVCKNCCVFNDSQNSESEFPLRHGLTWTFHYPCFYKSEYRCHHVVVILDYFMKTAVEVQTCDQTAQTMHTSFDFIMAVHRRVIKTRDLILKSKFFWEWCHSLGIKKSHTTPNHTQDNEACKMFICTLIQLLRNQGIGPNT